MFFLQDIPSDKVLKEFSEAYPDMDPLAVKTCLNLLKTGSNVLSGYEAMLNHHGLSTGRFLVLIILERNPELHLKPSEVAEKLGVSRATASGLIQKLEKQALISRFDDSSDRRQHLIGITEEGRALIRTILPDYYRRISAVMSPLDADEQKMFLLLLSKLDKSVGFFKKN